MSHLQALIGSLRTILPPAAFGVPAVDTWQQRVLASLDSWQATIDSHQDKLRKLVRANRRNPDARRVKGSVGNLNQRRLDGPSLMSIDRVVNRTLF